ncbi:uncharacterized protein LOC135146316 isoform X2 [Zophobas morio]|uniref:uncharacterized protein LOC135146316 isoform X2 n=1 Tax=Zophobas morio TaxID=2755281 RepID=UPI003083D471
MEEGIGQNSSLTGIDYENSHIVSSPKLIDKEEVEKTSLISFQSKEENFEYEKDLNEEELKDDNSLAIAENLNTDNSVLEEKTTEADSLSGFIDVIPDEDPDWIITEEDNLVHNKRYYVQDEGKTCFICLEKGHLGINCPNPEKAICVRCGFSGHRHGKCIEETCSLCFTPGHGNMNCPNKHLFRRDLRCDRCSTYGHVAKFHSTIQSGALVEGMEINSNPWCYICSRFGHFGHQCDSSSRLVEVSFPFIGAYCPSGDWEVARSGVYQINKKIIHPTEFKLDKPIRPLGRRGQSPHFNDFRHSRDRIKNRIRERDRERFRNRERERERAVFRPRDRVRERLRRGEPSLRARSRRNSGRFSVFAPPRREAPAPRRHRSPVRTRAPLPPQFSSKFVPRGDYGPPYAPRSKMEFKLRPPHPTSAAPFGGIKKRRRASEGYDPKKRRIGVFKGSTSRVRPEFSVPSPRFQYPQPPPTSERSTNKASNNRLYVPTGTDAGSFSSNINQMSNASEDSIIYGGDAISYRTTSNQHKKATTENFSAHTAKPGGAQYSHGGAYSTSFTKPITQTNLSARPRASSYVPPKGFCAPPAAGYPRVSSNVYVPFRTNTPACKPNEDVSTRPRGPYYDNAYQSISPLGAGPSQNRGPNISSIYVPPNNLSVGGSGGSYGGGNYYGGTLSNVASGAYGQDAGSNLNTSITNSTFNYSYRPGPPTTFANGTISNIYTNTNSTSFAAKSIGISGNPLSVPYNTPNTTFSGGVNYNTSYNTTNNTYQQPPRGNLQVGTYPR